MLSEVLRAEVGTAVVEIGAIELVPVGGFLVGTSVVIARIVVLVAVAVWISVSSAVLPVDRVIAPV